MFGIVQDGTLSWQEVGRPHGVPCVTVAHLRPAIPGNTKTCDVLQLYLLLPSATEVASGMLKLAAMCLACVLILSSMALLDMVRFSCSGVHCI